MQFKNCERCKKAFSSPVATAKFCPSCVQKNDEELDILTELIEFNNDITLPELIEKTGISEKIILRFVQAEKLPKFNMVMANCKKCGTEIASGNYCKNCLTKMSN